MVLRPVHAYGIVAIILIILATAWTRNENDKRISSETGICERQKADRVDTARALTQGERYFQLVASDERVPLKVRRAANRSQVLFHESANQLRSRIIDCGALIRDGKFQIDERLLKEAQGEL